MQTPDTVIADHIDALAEQLGPLFPRPETRTGAWDTSKGYSACERKNGWQMAEWLSDVSPDGVQYLLDRARWEADAARDVLRQWVIDTLDDPESVLVLDETGFIKMG